MVLLKADGLLFAGLFPATPGEDRVLTPSPKVLKIDKTLITPVLINIISVTLHKTIKFSKNENRALSELY